MALVALCLGTALPLLAGCGKQAQDPAAAGAQMPPLPVKTAPPLQREVMEWDEYTGRIEAMESVEIKARVDGYLTRVNFKAGDKVKKGDLLFLIDPRPYQAEAQRLEGEVERARARLELARNDLQRAEKLRKGRAISEEEYDARSKGLRETQAALRAAEAAVATVRLNLEFTEVRSPISGRIGRELITAGNLVEANATTLARVLSLDPVHVYLEADEHAVLKYRRLAQEGKRASARDTRVPAELALIDESGFPHKGYIDYLEPWLDTGTGTLRARGVFPNPDDLLSPGLFARVRVPGGAPYAALLVPNRAIGTDQEQKFLWIAHEDGSAERRRVVPGAVFGGYRAIREGLNPAEQVIVEGAQKIRPGVKIKPEPMVLSETEFEDGLPARAATGERP